MNNIEMTCNNCGNQSGRVRCESCMISYHDGVRVAKPSNWVPMSMVRSSELFPKNDNWNSALTCDPKTPGDYLCVALAPDSCGRGHQFYGVFEFTDEQEWDADGLIIVMWKEIIPPKELTIKLK